MGNQMSVPQRVEDQENEMEADTYKVASDSECVQNGIPVIVSTHTVQHYDEVDLGISVKKNNVASSSPKTVEIRTVPDANGKSLGKEAKPEAPAAKSRFFLTLSRPVPGRTGDQATDSSTGSVRLDVSSHTAPANKAPSESLAPPGAAAPEHTANKTSVPSPAQDQALAATWAPAPLPPESGEAVPSKSKDSSFFDKFFKLDKGREKAPVDSPQETKSAEPQEEANEIPGVSGQPDDVPAGQDIVEDEEKGQEIGTLSCSVPRDPEVVETAEVGCQTTDTTENNSIMSFFKTLVSPNKAEAKKDPEDVGAEKSPTDSADLKSDKANFIPQETQAAAKNPKGCNSSGHVQSVTSTETAKESAKEKSGPTSSPLGKLFWKKVVCESPVEIIKPKEVESTLQTVDLSEEEDAAPEPAEVKPKREESKAPRTSLLVFLRQMSVRGDGGSTHSEEMNGKDSSCQPSDSTEKAITPPEPELAGAAHKGKEGASKNKKPAAEVIKQKSNRQDAKDPAQCGEQATVRGNSLQNGDKPQKRPEKRRQSLGGFFKGLGPKRMLDAQVQTDPVSIGPVGKSK
ncbi:breast carcinoma-amplified sequence 1 isoform X3 [Cynocephalus volans]|uniref:breast carcinoma-amplified sequence 1 isoform X3 n=1 Tax=Cynocephalus volans TaxID=110931 RepID=UPI002FC6084F